LTIKQYFLKARSRVLGPGGSEGFKFPSGSVILRAARAVKVAKNPGSHDVNEEIEDE